MIPACGKITSSLCVTLKSVILFVGQTKQDDITLGARKYRNYCLLFYRPENGLIDHENNHPGFLSVLVSISLE